MNKRALMALRNEIRAARDNMRVLLSEDGTGWDFPDGALAGMYTQLLRMCTMLDGKIEKGRAWDADQGRDEG